jgi:hypothetical protein
MGWGIAFALTNNAQGLRITFKLTGNVLMKNKIDEGPFQGHILSLVRFNIKESLSNTRSNGLKPRL